MSKNDFVKLPKALFRNPQYTDIPVTAKVLYAFLLDRSSLSRSKGKAWKDKDGNVYVHFSVREAMERFGCKHEKAGALFHILEEKNLITRYANGFGKPYRIVVRPICFSDSEVSDDPTHESDFSDTNKTECNYTDSNQTDSVMARRMIVENTIKENISYDVLLGQMSQELLDGIVDVIVDTICTPGETIWVSRERLPREEVSNRFYALDDMDIHYVADSISREKNDIQYLRKYILSRLYEAKQLSATYYERWYKQDG